MCDRLVRKGLVRRTRASADRRVVRLTLTKGGHALVAEVARHRRAELARLVSLIPDGSHTALVAALRAIANAAGEPADSHWELAWQESEQSGERLAAAG
jgi:DNA-binding MarR family transcriptional regulator